MRGPTSTSMGAGQAEAARPYRHSERTLLRERQREAAEGAPKSRSQIARPVPAERGRPHTIPSQTATAVVCSFRIALFGSLEGELKGRDSLRDPKGGFKTRNCAFAKRASLK